MIPAGRDEILPRFAGISAVLWILHKLYLAIICEKFDPGKAAFFVLPGSFTGAKLFHGIVSARLSRTKKLYTSVWKNLLKYISINRIYFYCIYTARMTSICEKKSRQMSLQNLIILWTFRNQWEFMDSYKQVPPCQDGNWFPHVIVGWNP